MFTSVAGGQAPCMVQSLVLEWGSSTSRPTSVRKRRLEAVMAWQHSSPLSGLGYRLQQPWARSQPLCSSANSACAHAGQLAGPGNGAGSTG